LPLLINIQPGNQSGSPANGNFASLRRLKNTKKHRMLAGRISPGRPQTPAGNTAKALLATTPQNIWLHSTLSTKSEKLHQINKA
jgi:hypothetical protein